MSEGSPGTWEDDGSDLGYRCACDGCWACEGKTLDCACDVDWDKVYGHE